jgi:hypothetical protein
MSLLGRYAAPDIFATFGTKDAQGAYWQEHRALSQELCPYRYVQGLREDDPKDLVVFYRKTKTRWRTKRPSSYEKTPRWLVMVPGCDGYWGNQAGGWIDTPEFRARLTKTLAYLEEQGRPNWAQTRREHAAFLAALGQ